MITEVKKILNDAKNGGYAVGAFNTVNLETTQAILAAAEKQNTPVIIQITEKTMKYAGGRTLFSLIENMVENHYAGVQVGIHLDHGKSFEIIQRAIDIGLTSVMYDGSRKDYKDNLLMTKKITEYCHKKNISVQAELGNVPYLSEVGMTEIDWNDYMTDPEQAEEFVEKTGIDALAVAIGNAHDFAKERSVPDYQRLQDIRNRVDVPLIMHGTSDWTEEKISKSVAIGVNCFNVDTAIRMAFTNSLAMNFNKDKNIHFDVRKYLKEATESAQKVIEKKMKLFK